LPLLSLGTSILCGEVMLARADKPIQNAGRRMRKVIRSALMRPGVRIW